MDTKQNIDTWDTFNRINLYLFDTLKDEHFVDMRSSKGLKSRRAVFIYSPFSIEAVKESQTRLAKSA